MDIVFIVSSIAVFALGCLVLFWLFLPAITYLQIDHEKNRKRNIFSDAKGAIETHDLIKEEAKFDISLVVPAFNEEIRLVPMLEDTMQFMLSWGSRMSLSYEIIVVDDGSTDNTASLVKRYMKKNAHIKLLQLGSNRGKGGAVKCGVGCALGRYILMVDADAATDIRDLEKMYSRLQASERHNNNVIPPKPVGLAVGSRAHMAEDSVAKRSLLRTILMKGFHILVMVLISRNVHDTQCGFKLFTRESARILFNMLHLERWSFDVELIFLAERFHMPVAEVPVNWHEVDGSKLIQSKWDIAKTAITMARDMLCVRLCYTLGLWGCDNSYSIRDFSEKKSQ